MNSEDSLNWREKVKSTLRGINETSDSPNGWWRTKLEAEFGQIKLDEILRIVRHMDDQITQARTVAIEVSKSLLPCQKKNCKCAACKLHNLANKWEKQNVQFDATKTSKA